MNNNPLITPKNSVTPTQNGAVEIKDEQYLEQLQQAPVVPGIQTEYDDVASNVFISDALSDLEKLVEEQEMLENPTLSTTNTQSGVDEAPVKIEDMLKNISVDLNNIELSTNSNILDMQRTEALFNAKPTKQIVCCQSAYSAQMSALKTQEINNLLESDTDYYAYRKKITQIAHKHMESTSIGKMNFPTWEKVTSYYDFESILYGLYCQTFPHDNKYNIVCPAKDCKKSYSTVANNNTLVETRGKEDVYARVDEVISQVKTPMDCKGKSHVHKIKRVMVDETKVIFDIHLPTIHDYLEGILAKATPEFTQEYSTSLGLALFINALYVPNLAVLKETGKLTYFKIDDVMEMVKYIGNVLTYEDSLQLTEEVNDFTEKYRVSYSLKNVTCPHCGHVIDTIPLDMEELLFHVVRQGRQKAVEENNEPNM